MATLSRAAIEPAAQVAAAPDDDQLDLLASAEPDGLELHGAVDAVPLHHRAGPRPEADDLEARHEAGSGLR